jgi:tetratricopeptide (TPR) repeat protein
VLRRIAQASLLFAAAMLLAYLGFRRLTRFTPPEGAGPPLPKEVELQHRGGLLRQVVGGSALWRDRGIWRIDLEGTPRQLGHAHGMLARRQNDAFDRAMVELMRRQVPSGLGRWLIGNLIRWRFRNLTRWVPADRLVELAALARNLADTGEYPERPFQRVVYYHALYDITQRLERSPLLACTAFAAWGEHTVDGHLIVGRNFDFEAGAIFDRQKAVILFRPPGRIPFVSVAWPGMTGVVTGVNARGLFVGLNAARTDDKWTNGVPVVFVVRELLERAGTLDEAIALLRDRQLMGAQGLLLADGGQGRAVVVELPPSKMVVRRARTTALGLTNHFLDGRFVRDRANDRARRYTTSGVRLKRLEQLLEQGRGAIDPATAARILRDRKDPEGRSLPLGHRRAIDAISATHSVVLDLSEMVLWVSRGPHLLGSYVALDLAALFARGGERTITALPGDPIDGSGELASLRVARAEIDHARRLQAVGRGDAALDHARRAASAAPRLPEAQLLLADLTQQQQGLARARSRYERFLALAPPALADVQRVRALLGRAQKPRPMRK